MRTESIHVLHQELVRGEALVCEVKNSRSPAGTRKVAERPVATTSSQALALLVFDARFGSHGVTPVNQVELLDVHKASPCALVKMRNFRPKYYEPRR